MRFFYKEGTAEAGLEQILVYVFFLPALLVLSAVAGVLHVLAVVGTKITKGF